MSVDFCAGINCPDAGLIAGLQNGDLLLTEDAGETWRTLSTGLDSLLALSESAG